MPARNLFNSARAVRRWLRNPMTLSKLGLGRFLTNLGIGLADVGEALTSAAIAELARKGRGA